MFFVFLSSQSFAGFDNFITRDGHQLKDKQKVFRFAGIHAPELHRIEDDARGVCKADRRGWGQYFKWPSAAEQENWIKSLVGTGHKAMRIYVLSVAHPDDQACGRETHILPPAEKGGMPRLNERAMQVYDRMIALSDEHGLRLILPFIDHWEWWGGRKQLAAFYNESEDDFYDTRSQTFAAYLHIIEQVITRKNTLTNRHYFQEKAIMAWETGNELKFSTAEFVSKTAAHIKKLAPQQLVVDGNYLSILPSSLEDPNVDIISNHFYTVNDNNKPETIIKDLTKIAGKKVYFLGEFGLAPHTRLNEIMQTAVHADVNGAKTAGAFIWGMRGHREEGGFYWHAESSGHYSYHLPGFTDGEANQELPVINLVRLAMAHMDGASEIRPLPIPEAPHLHPIGKNREINWMGSPTGQYYHIERREAGDSDWLRIASKVSDGRNKFDPKTDDLYIDQTAIPAGKQFQYRIIAGNETGLSTPSNVQVFTSPPKDTSEFVSVSDGQFMLNNKPYYFVGTNYWYGPLLGSTETGQQRLLKELDHLKASGVTNLRVLVGTDGGNGASVVKPALQKSPGVYNTDLFYGLDFLLAEMQKRDMKAVLYLTNNWIWSGGMSQYLNWNGYGEVPNPFFEEYSWQDYMNFTLQFHSCDPCIADFERHLIHVVSRKNQITGVPYTLDPTIMSWQVANEPRLMAKDNFEAFSKWLNRTVELLNSLAPAQLISTGSEGKAGAQNDVQLWQQLHTNPDIDYLTVHVWPKNWNWYDPKNEAESLITSIKHAFHYIDEHHSFAVASGRPMVLEEFGFPREQERLTTDASTQYRDQFIEAILDKLLYSKRTDGVFSGINTWAYGGFGKANPESHGVWAVGDDYLGDPAQEPQGLNTIFATDTTTFELKKRYALQLVE